MKVKTVLPEVTLLYDARGRRTLSAWATSGTSRRSGTPPLPRREGSLAGLCSFLGHGQINRKDLRGTLKNSTDEEIVAAHEDLVHHGLLVPADEVMGCGVLSGYRVRSMREVKS